MFINEVISYNGAWELLDKKHPQLLEKLDHIFEDVENSAIKVFYKGETPYLGDLQSAILDQINKGLEEINFVYEKVFREFIGDTKECLIYHKQIMIDYI